MSRFLLSEEICPDQIYEYEFFKYDFLSINMLFFFMVSFIELPLCASRHFSMIFLINAHLEEDVFIRREALKKVHLLLTFLEPVTTTA